MSAAQKHQGFFTADEYLAFEERQEIRHEYVGGQLYAMVGGTQRHNLIITNISGRLWSNAGSLPCRVFSQGMKVRSSPNTFYYPDIVMTCDPTDDAELYPERPSLIVEVLSKSTGDIDTREKLLQYQQIESLQTYLIVAQETIGAYHHWRDGDGTWQTQYLIGNFAIPIPQLDTQLTIHDIYAGVIDIQIS